MFTGYTLRFSRRRSEMDIVIVPTTYVAIYELVSQRKSLVSFLTEKDSFTRISFLFHSNEIRTKIISASDLTDDLPSDTFMLSEDIPNKVDLIRQQVMLERKLKNFPQ